MKQFTVLSFIVCMSIVRMWDLFCDYLLHSSPSFGVSNRPSLMYMAISLLLLCPRHEVEEGI